MYTVHAAPAAGRGRQGRPHRRGRRRTDAPHAPGAAAPPWRQAARDEPRRRPHGATDRGGAAAAARHDRRRPPAAAAAADARHTADRRASEGTQRNARAGRSAPRGPRTPHAADPSGSGGRHDRAPTIHHVWWGDGMPPRPLLPRATNHTRSGPAFPPPCPPPASAHSSAAPPSLGRRRRRWARRRAPPPPPCARASRTPSDAPRNDGGTAPAGAASTAPISSGLSIASPAAVRRASARLSAAAPRWGAASNSGLTYVSSRRWRRGKRERR